MKYTMKHKIAAATISAALLFGPVAAMPAPSAYAATQSAEVQWGVNMRTAPSTSSSVIRMIKKGEKVTIVEKSGSHWYKIKDANGKTGYISSSSKYTKLVSGTSGSGSTTGSASSSSGSASQTSSNSTVEKIISTGMTYLGTPYEFGSNRNSTATFDCSDFVKHIFNKAAGIKLPADSRQQGAYVKNKGNYTTDISKLKRGDLMFFMSYKGSKASSYSGVNKSSQRITHVAIYLGDGKVLHTYSKASGGVRTNSINNTHWEYRFLFGGSAL